MSEVALGTPIVHANCGKPAVMLRAGLAPKPGDIVDLNHFVHVDGRPVVGGDFMDCDSCGKVFYGFGPSFDGSEWRAYS